MEYSGDTPQNRNGGWNVPKDTVISFVINIPMRETDVTKASRGNEWIGLFTGGARFNVNGGLGIVEQLDVADTIIAKGYYPTPSDSPKRCKGFPKYDLLSSLYEPFVKFSTSNQDAMDYEVLNIVSRSTKSPTFQMFMFIYGSYKDLDGKNIKKVHSQILQKIERVPNIKLIWGGCREESHVEAFFLPPGLPAAVASPSFLCKAKFNLNK